MFWNRLTMEALPAVSDEFPRTGQDSRALQPGFRPAPEEPAQLFLRLNS